MPVEVVGDVVQVQVIAPQVAVIEVPAQIAVDVQVTLGPAGPSGVLPTVIVETLT